MRLRISEPGTLRVTFYDDGENAVDPGAVTIGITGYAGTVVAAGTATSGTGATERTFVITPTLLDDWTVTWTAGSRTRTQQVTIVGDYLFELADLRAMDPLNDQARYTAAALKHARDTASDLFESYCGVAFVPRHTRVVNSGMMFYPNVQRIRSLKRAQVNGVDMTTPPTLWRSELNWAFAQPIPYPGWLGAYNPLTGGPDQLVLDFEVGYDSPPQEVREAAMRYARYILLQGTSRIPDRATNLTTPDGTFQLTTANMQAERPTGIPEIDAVLNNYRRRTTVFA